MVQSRLLRRLGLFAALAAGYFVAGKLGLEVAYIHPSATAVWPNTGLTLAALLRAGRAAVGRAPPGALDPAPGARGRRPARVPRRRRDRRLRRARPVEGQALSPGIPVRSAALVGGVPVRAARGGDGRGAARRCRDLGHAARLRTLRPAAVQRVTAPAAGVPGGLGRHHAGPRGGGA